MGGFENGPFWAVVFDPVSGLRSAHRPHGKTAPVVNGAVQQRAVKCWTWHPLCAPFVNRYKETSHSPSFCVALLQVALGRLQNAVQCMYLQVRGECRTVRGRATLFQFGRAAPKKLHLHRPPPTQPFPHHFSPSPLPAPPPAAYTGRAEPPCTGPARWLGVDAKELHWVQALAPPNTPPASTPNNGSPWHPSAPLLDS